MRNLENNLKKGHGRVPGIVSGTRPRRCNLLSLCRSLLKEESGQMLPWVGLMMTVMVGISALAIDVAHAMVIQRQLQSSTDAAAIAAAETLPNTDYTTVGQNYGGASGDMNTKGYTITGPTITGLCLTTVSGWGAPCSKSPLQPNAVSATETATFNTYFGWILGQKTITVTATSWAAAKGSVPLAYNVAIIVDSTLSMYASDSNCGNISQMQCALNGVQQLLKSLNPATDHVALFTFPNVTYGSAAGTATSGTFNCTTTIPSSFGGSSYAYSKSYGYYPMLREPSPYQTPYTGVAWAMPYTFPPIPADTSGYNPPTTTDGPTYEVVPFSTDYRTSNTSTTLNTSSNLVKASGAVSGCNGIAPSNYDGDYGTYYAGVLYAAQAALLAEQTKNTGSTNAIVVLGDGNSNAPSASGGSPDSNSPSMPNTATLSTTTFSTTSKLTTTAYTFPSNYLVAEQNGSGVYPSSVGECGQAVDAAQYAATYPGNNSRVYTVAYGALTSSSSSNCGTDRTSASSHRNISPCATLQQMASGSTSSSTSNYFYSDYNVPGGDSGCVANSSNSAITSLNQIFQSIAVSMTSVRLIPVNTP